MDKNEIIKKFTQDSDERLLLARILDKLEEARRRNIPTSSRFLNEQQRAIVEAMLEYCGNPRHVFHGGYNDAKRTVVIFLPIYMEPEDVMQGDTDPLAYLGAVP